jgi:hypothetical protein
MTLKVTSKDDQPPQQSQKPIVNPLIADQSQNALQMTHRIESSFMAVRRYEDASLQAKARACIPIEELKQKAKVSEEGSGYDFNDRLLLELLHWFKASFFKWVNAPACSGTRPWPRATVQRICV